MSLKVLTYREYSHPNCVDFAFLPLDLADLFSQHHLVASHVELSFAPEKQVLNIFFSRKKWKIENGDEKSNKNEITSRRFWASSCRERACSVSECEKWSKSELAFARIFIMGSY